MFIFGLCCSSWSYILSNRSIRGSISNGVSSNLYSEVRYSWDRSTFSVLRLSYDFCFAGDHCVGDWEGGCEFTKVTEIRFMKSSRSWIFFDFVLKVLRSLWKVESKGLTWIDLCCREYMKCQVPSTSSMHIGISKFLTQKNSLLVSWYLKRKTIEVLLLNIYYLPWTF